jgi:hypothetical protein
MAGGIVAAIAAAAIVAKGFGDMLQTATESVGKFAVAIADPSSDPAKPIASFGSRIAAMGQSMESFSSATFNVGGIVMAQIPKAVGSVVSSLAELTQSLTATAHRYGEYNPQIAIAEAMGEVRQVMGDLRRAQQVAPEMSRFLEARADLEQTLEDIKANLLTEIVPMATAMLRILNALAPVGEAAIKIVANTSPLFKTLEVISRIMEWLDRHEDEGAGDQTADFLAGFLPPGFGGGPGIRTPNL